mgnify:FL=1
MADENTEIRILNEDDEEITMDEVDLELGYLRPDQLLKEHHEAIEFQEEQWHYAVACFYFEDGSELKVESEDDPHIEKIDADNGVFGFIPQNEEEEQLAVKGIDLKQEVDKERVEAKEAWDEYENIQRYILYTQEELDAKREREEQQAKREEFMGTGPDRLSTVEEDVGDLSIILSETMLAMM